MAWEEPIAPASRLLARRVAKVAAVCTGAIGLTALLGWMLGNEGLKTIAVGTATMKVNTAICLVLAALSLWFAAARPAKTWMERVSALAPIAIGVIATLTLVEYVFGANFGIDELFTHDPAPYAQGAPGRMALPTITAFLLFVFAIRAARRNARYTRGFFLATTLTGLALATLVVIGYAYDLPILYAPTPENSIALNSGVAFFILFAGVSALRPDLGWFALLEATSISGIFARWLLPAIVFLPLLLGFVIWRLSKAELLGAQESLALFALSSIVGMGAVTWGVGVITNRLGARLKMREQVLTSVVETALDAFIMMDERGEVLHWNARATEVFGWSAEEATGRSLKDLILTPDMSADFEQTFEEYLAINDVNVMRRRRERIVQDRDGKRIPAEFATYPVRFQSGWVISMFVKDLSELRHAEEQLRQAQKMEAIGQLTSGLAHDFNNLLTVIVASLDSLLPRVSEILQPRVAAALQAADRGAALTKQLLAYARRQTLSPEALDLKDVTETLWSIIERTLGSSIELEFRLAPEPCVAFADRAQVESALLNLAINARDAMPNGGHLLIETGRADLDAAYCALNSDVAPGAYAVLSVSDTGEGMSPEVRNRAFEPFFTTKEIGKGSGLGLSMIYGFAKQSHGHVKIYSEIGHGTTVRLYLPLAGEEAGTHILQVAQESDHLARGETILVVEDDANVRSLALMHLRELGYQTLEAANGSEALTILQNGEPIDLLFTDVMMPGGMTGRQLAIKAQAFRPGLKTLYTSGYTDNSIVHDGRLDPGVAFLSKPYRLRDLAAKIRQAIENESTY